MGYQAKVLCDSASPAGHRLTTFVVTFPRFILAEFNTHRMLSRNAASSRAIPVTKRINAVREDPFIPEEFGRNQAGMQAGDPLDGDNLVMARAAWLDASSVAIEYASRLSKLGAHKQLANRLLEPFSWVTVVVSATDWNNFFNLRCHPDAQPEFQKIARQMREALSASTPVLKAPGEWHLPFIESRDVDEVREAYNGTLSALPHISSARCARVSYLTHDGKRSLAEDVSLHDRLLSAGHMSPFEHPARCMLNAKREGNFTGWLQYRKTIMYEQDRLGAHRSNVSAGAN